MRSGSRWGLVTLILAILALLVSIIGPISGLKNRNEMGASIQNALNAGGYKDVAVNMSGNVAKLSGAVSTDARKASAMELAKNTACEKCKGKKARSWHGVKDDGLAVKTVNVSPYTFKVTKAEDGAVVLDGYVQNADEKAAVLAHAKSVYGNRYTDRTIRIAAGAPNGQWETAIKQQMSNLNKMDSGQAFLEDKSASLVGKMGSAEEKAVLMSTSAMPSAYTLTESISVPAGPATVIRSQDVCQDLISGLKGNDRVNFRYGKADIDPSSFAMLNKLAGAIKRCPDFVVRVEGHTDSDGGDAYNLRLSDLRAGTVAAYLQDQNVPAANVTAQGFGETNPIASNATAEGKAQNRRIDFIVTRSN